MNIKVTRRTKVGFGYTTENAQNISRLTEKIPMYEGMNYEADAVNFAVK